MSENEEIERVASDDPLTKEQVQTNEKSSPSPSNVRHCNEAVSPSIESERFCSFRRSKMNRMKVKNVV